jgi:hypothetical protein
LAYQPIIGFIQIVWAAAGFGSVLLNWAAYSSNSPFNCPFLAKLRLQSCRPSEDGLA